MAIKPMLFNTEMVRAVLRGQKTCTRRLVKPQPIPDVREAEEGDVIMYFGELCRLRSPKSNRKYAGELEAVPIYSYRPGDILYVRETWARLYSADNPQGRYVYKATDEYPFGESGYIVKFRWFPSIHMPKEAARIFLRLTDVRVERLQDCGNMQAKDEGCTCCSQFARVWDSTIKTADLDHYGWEANPWVWVIEFERISKEAALGGATP